MGINLAKLIAKNLTKFGKPIGVKACTLIKVTNGTRTPGAVTGGTNPTETSYAASGWIEDFEARDIDGTLIVASDRKISILGASIAGGQVPTPDDKVTIADPSGVVATYRVCSPVGGDGVGAVYVVQGRK